ncbi:hypothetical protein [Aliikangiella coralliicola]|uniref:Uncharacterized protein n=1 Tax=Aliikangiella coralliicola TaxID=2592383 RepID=A0A545U4B3_9GAMM|nr:hypothetical protein [Aliikangiella coralliicola]TQV84331.1 hypothetical protein FLL46_22155 [Aliikangiella coralliicola]
MNLRQTVFCFAVSILTMAAGFVVFSVDPSQWSLVFVGFGLLAMTVYFWLINPNKLVEIKQPLLLAARSPQNRSSN